jgi:hypothetical protein
MEDRVKVDLQFGFQREQAEEALAILISGYYMLESFQKAKHRFRSNYPEVFTSSEEMMIADGLTQTEAESNTIQALEQYFDLLGKMVYMLGYELAQELGAPFPEEETIVAHRQVSDLDQEEVMNELSRIMNINN